MRAEEIQSIPTVTPIDLSSLSDGDRVEVCFEPPVIDPELGEIIRASGAVRAIAGRHFLLADSHRTAWRRSACLDLDPKYLASVVVVETAEQVAARRAEQARGEKVYDRRPSSPADLQRQLDTLAEMIALEEDTRIIGGRKRQLERQFDEIADLVSLAKTKRTYILTRAIVGSDFHPWLTRHERVFRNGTVRPLPADFEFDQSLKIDREARLQQSIHIFGEAERETRNIASALRALGYDVRRPHPNAQELFVRFTEGRLVADVIVAPSSNGLWQSSARPADNKTKARAVRRLLRTDILSALARNIEVATGAR